MIPPAQPITKSKELGAFLTDVLAQIRVANGYRTDIGARVFRGKLKQDKDQMPYAVLIEGEDRPADQGVAQAVIIQQYAVGAYLACDADNPNDAAHDAIHDIKRAIFSQGEGPGRPRLGNRVKDVRYLGKDIGPRADGEASVFAVVHFECRFTETLHDA